MGGRWLHIGLWSWRIYLIFGKKTHFQGYRRGDYGERMKGCLNGGAQERRWIHIWRIFYLQKRDFLISMFVWAWKGGAPPSAPPWIHFRNIKIWYVTINQNKKSLIFDYSRHFLKWYTILGYSETSDFFREFSSESHRILFLGQLLGVFSVGNSGLTIFQG